MQLNAMLLFLGDVGGGEIMVIMLAVLLLFGADKIPGLARSLGSGIREFKDATNGIKNEIERSINDDEPRVTLKKTKVQDQVEPTGIVPEQNDEEPKSL
jgi:sec-independent protein translocase protein TatA